MNNEISKEVYDAVILIDSLCSVYSTCMQCPFGKKVGEYTQCILMNEVPNEWHSRVMRIEPRGETYEVIS